MWARPWQEKWGCLDIHELVNPLGSPHTARMRACMFIRGSKSAANMRLREDFLGRKKNLTTNTAEYQQAYPCQNKAQPKIKEPICPSDVGDF